jgi:hypothetical protein
MERSFAELYLTGPVVLAMDLLRFKDQFKERLLIDFTDLFPGGRLLFQWWVCRPSLRAASPEQSTLRYLR